MSSHSGPPVVALVNSESRMGGVEFSTLYLVEQMDRSRFLPLIICPAEGDLPARCRKAGIPVKIVSRARTFSTSLRVGRGERGRYIPNPLAWVANLVSFVVTARRLARALRRYRVALVCTKGMMAHFYGGLAAWLAGVPCIWHIQDLVSERAGGLYARVLGLGGKLLAQQIIADGGTIRDQIGRYLPADQLSVIHNGVDTNVFTPSVNGMDVRREWQVQDQELVVGNIARITRWKGQDHLLRAFAAVANDFPYCKLVLVGAPVFDSDEYERELRTIARTLDIERRVILAGYRWDMPQTLAAIDIFVHSSIEKDTSPLSVVSAMASGKAILSTNVAGVAELFAKGEALLVPPANDTAMSVGLRALLSNAGMRRELGQAARRKAEASLSLPMFTRRCEAVFEKALADSVRT